MPVVAQGELLAGVLQTSSGKRQAELLHLYEQVVTEATDILHIDSEVAERFASIVAQLRRDGRPIETNDIWIAATAMTHGLTVVSSDPDFRNVSGLSVEDWSLV